MNRKLPRYILNTPPNPYKHWEGQYVLDKYSNPDAVIGEDNVDHVALLFMNVEAQLYWLPKFLEYLEKQKSYDSFLYDAMLFRLSDTKFSQPLLKVATKQEVKRVRAYLDWYEAEKLGT